MKTIEDLNIIYLEDNSIELEGFKFYGSPWSPQFFNWSFMKSEHELEKIFRKIDYDTNFLITHSPPYSILDKTKNKKHVGSKSLLETIKDLPNLKYSTFGHIHESSGQLNRFGIDFFNSAVMIDLKPKIINI